jgi:Fe-S cluster biogenesis protein NfuA
MPTTVITVAEAEAILARKVRPAIRGHAGDVHVVEVGLDAVVCSDARVPEAWMSRALRRLRR